MLDESNVQEDPDDGRKEDIFNFTHSQVQLKQPKDRGTKDDSIILKNKQ